MGSRLCDAEMKLYNREIFSVRIHHKANLFYQETKFFSQTTDTDGEGCSPESWFTLKVSGTELNVTLPYFVFK